MGHNLDVSVKRADGKPIAGAEVAIDIQGAVKRETLNETTGGDGHARFETQGEYEPSRLLTIQVGDESFGPHEIKIGAYTVELER